MENTRTHPYVCSSCGGAFPEGKVDHICRVCGGIYDLEAEICYDKNLIEDDLPGIWRYRHTFQLPEDSPTVHLGEGSTPLVFRNIKGKKVGFKLEYLNPTGSFKDRGTALLVSFLKARGVSSVVEDSSGNAGASLSAYSSANGIKTKIYVPDYASGKKIEQMEMYGAEVVRVPGERSKVSEAVLDEIQEDVVYASHAYLPMGIPGFATCAYEIAEEIGDKYFSIITPVGQGTLLSGLMYGFNALSKSGYLKHFPFTCGVQARRCAPLWALQKYGTLGSQLVSEGETIAEGIRIRYPVRGDKILKSILAHKGRFYAIDEKDIERGHNELAEMGFYVEPTSAVVWKVMMDFIEVLPEPIILILTGSGLKA